MENKRGSLEVHQHNAFSLERLELMVFMNKESFMLNCLGMLLQDLKMLSNNNPKSLW